MGEDQSLGFCRERHLRRFLRRRVPGVAGALALLLAEGRLVNQEIGALRRVDRRGTGARIAGDDDEPPWSRSTDEAFCRQPSAVSKLDRLALCQLAPQRPLGNAGRLGLLDVEAPAAHLLLQHIAQRGPAAVLRGERADVVPVPFPDRTPSLHPVDSDWEGTLSTPSCMALARTFFAPLGP